MKHHFDHVAANFSTPEARVNQAISAVSGEFRPGALPDEAFEIRPVNSDNQRDLDMVVELLRRYQSSDVQSRGLSDSEFLYSHFSELETDEQLVSLLVFHQNRPVAHAALRFQQGSVCPEIVLPAIDPEYLSYLVVFSNLLWEKIEHLAARQSWEMIYQFSPVADAALQIISAKHFDALEMAVLPDPSVASEDARMARHSNQSIVLLVHLFQNRIDRPRYLYPLRHHATKVSELFEPLDAKRIVVELNGQAASSGGLDNPAEIVGRNMWLQIAGLEERAVIPSQLSNIDAELGQIFDRAEQARAQRTGFWVRVALDDRSSPHFCQKLEELGFRFCGLFPVIQGRDWILYSAFDRVSLPQHTLRTPRGRNLVEYISAQTDSIHSKVSVAKESRSLRTGGRG